VKSDGASDDGIAGVNPRVARLGQYVADFYRSDIRTGLKIIVTSLAVCGITILPLLLYVVFGPAGGNPVGLGLLAMIGWVAIAFGVPVGVVWLLYELVTKRSF
jgi:hypothetical protein